MIVGALPVGALPQLFRETRAQLLFLYFAILLQTANIRGKLLIE